MRSNNYLRRIKKIHPRKNLPNNLPPPQTKLNHPITKPKEKGRGRRGNVVSLLPTPYID